MQAALVPLFLRARARWLLASLFVVLALVPQIALAQTANTYGFVDQCYAVADELPGSANLQTDTLTRLDRSTGQSYVIGQTGSTNMENLAFGPGRTLYGVDGGQLGTLNANTGAFTPRPSVIGTGRGSAGNISLNNVDGLSYDLTRDIFFAIHRRNDGSTNATVKPDLLFAINPQTGALIPNQFGLGVDYVVVPAILGVSGRLLGDVDDISFHPATGDLYGLLNTNGAGARLVTIDVNTGGIDTGEVIRYPNPYPQNPALAGQIIDDIEGLSFFNTGRLFASTGTNGPDPVDLNSLFEIDIAASTGVLIGPFPNQPPGAAPRDYEGLACLTAEAAIVMDKFTNGPGQLPDDADEPIGPYIQAGAPVTWTYLFTNTSFVTLTDFSLVDDRIGTISCPPANLLLAPGDGFACTATGTATLGQYTNTAVITATSQIGLLTPRQTVTSTDPSHYFGMSPAIAIKKYTNGEDADTPTGPLVPVGSAVAWTYVVTNTGSDLLTNVTVTDDQGVVVSCPKNTLAVGEVMTCTAGGIATAGQYANIGVVTGTPPAGPNVVAADPSHYFGVAPGIAIKKYTNGEDADTPTGPQIPVGGAVTWTYVVTNTGNQILTEVTVSDDQGVSVGCPKDTLAVGEVMTCTASGIATAGQYANMGTVVGTPPVGPNVAAADPSHYYGYVIPAPGIAIKKYTNGEDADTPTGPQIPVGSAVAWTYVVTNTGNVPLTNVAVSDDQGVSVSCPKNTLAVGEVMTCAANGTAVAGQYANIGTATGTPPTGPAVTSADPSHYFGYIVPAPGIAIKKYTNGEDADTPTGPQIPVGGAVSWTYVVTNTGNVPLTGVAVTDDQGVAVSCPKNTLATGEVMTCTASGIATAGQYANIGTATGTPPTGPNITAADPSHYFGFVIPPAPAQVGDLVWLDDNANGMQDPSESGVSGVEVRLYTAAGTLVQTQLTSPAGLYLFTDVAPGSYYIVFINTHADTAFTTANQGGDDARDSDVDLTLPSGLPGDNVGRTATFTLAPGADDRTWDAGLVSVSGQGTAAIGDRVWNDTNQDGVQDAGEIGAPDVTVRLYTNVAGVFTVLRTTTTDALGLYRFDNLSAGQYLVEFVAPPERALSPRNAAAATTENDSDADLVTGRTVVITLPDGVTDLSWDAGISVMPNAEPPTDEPGQRPSLFIPLISR